MTTADTPIFPRDLMALLGITHPNTLRVQIKTGKVPPPAIIVFECEYLIEPEAMA